MSTILISGASSSLAADIVSRYKKSKHRLILLFRTLDKKTIKEYKHKDYVLLEGDINIEKNFNKIEKFFLNKSININFAIHFNGVHSFKTIKLIKNEDFKNVYDANVLSFINFVKLITKINLSKNLESILTISSVSSLKGNKAISLYSSSKSSLNNLVKSFALELSQRKIRVNSVNLGHIHSGMGLEYQKNFGKSLYQELEKKHPLGFGNTKDLFHIIEFLSNKTKARWITGANINLDGGYSI